MGLTGGGNIGNRLQGSGKGDLLPNNLQASSYQTYTLTFEPNSAKYNALTIEQKGTIQQIDAPSGTTVYRINSNTPFKQQISTGDTVEKQDFIEAELPSKPTTTITVEVVLTYADQSIAKEGLDVSGGEYMYSFINTQQKMFVIDTVNDTIAATINIPAPSVSGNEVTVPAYRNINKSIYVFGEGRVVRIDADPNSSSFNTITDDQDLTGFAGGIKPEKGKIAVYNALNDVFYFGSRQMAEYDPVNRTARLILKNEVIGAREALAIGEDALYLHSLSAVFFRKRMLFLPSFTLLNTRSLGVENGRSEGFFYSPELGAWVTLWHSNYRAFTFNGIKPVQLASINQILQFGARIYDNVNGNGIIFDNDLPKVQKVDLASFTSTAIGNYQSSPSSVLTLNAETDGQGFVWVRDDGNGLLYKLDPAQSPSNMKVAQINLPNYSGARQVEGTMEANKLKLL